MNLKIKLIFLALIFINTTLITSSVNAQQLAEPGPGEVNEFNRDSSYVILTNWENPMDANGCVIIEDDFSVTIHLRLNLLTDELSSFPPIYLQPHFNYNYGAVLGPVDESDLFQVEIDGFIYYSVEYTLTYDATSNCTTGSGNPSALEYGIDIITPNSGSSSNGNNSSFVAYPISANLGTLFAEESFFAGYGPKYSNVFLSHKQICCSSSQRVSVNTNSSYLDNSNIINNPSPSSDDFLSSEEPLNFTSLNTLKNVTFQPNPFSQNLEVVFNQGDYMDKDLRIFSTTGELILTKRIVPSDVNRNSLSISLEHLPNGVYWCVVGNMAPKKIIKILP